MPHCWKSHALAHNICSINFISAWKMALEEARAASPSVNQPGQQVMYPHTMHGGYAGDVLMTGGQYGKCYE